MKMNVCESKRKNLTNLTATLSNWLNYWSLGKFNHYGSHLFKLWLLFSSLNASWVMTIILISCWITFENTASSHAAILRQNLEVMYYYKFYVVGALTIVQHFRTLDGSCNNRCQGYKTFSVTDTGQMCQSLCSWQALSA